MNPTDKKDVFSGGFLVLMGLAVLVISFTDYRIGTFARMGPGLFPAIIGGVLAILGVAVALPPLLKRSSDAKELPTGDWRPFFVVIGSIVAFAGAMQFFGLIPAIVVTTLMSSFAHPRASLVQGALVSAGLSLIAVLLFRVLLEIPLDLFRWPLS